MSKRVRFFVLNDPQTAVINRALAQEIGLIESVLLMQIEFLISISQNERDGRFWTYQSLANLHETYFPYWSKATLGRAMQQLVERDLLIVGNYNKSRIDRTPWYALNPVGLARLHSLRVDEGHETPSSQNETSPLPDPPATSHHETTTSQDESSSSHGETAIPETTSETTQRDEGPIDELSEIRAMSPEERLLLFEQRRDELSRMPRLERRGGR